MAMRARWCIAALFVVSCGPIPVQAWAQTAINTAPATRSDLGPTDFVNAALQVVAAVDRYEMGSVWDRASAVMKNSVARDDFVASTAQQRAALGAVRSRDWTNVARVLVAQAGGPLPPGQYLTVRLTSMGDNGRRMEEVISFHLDGDGQWRLAGYGLQ
jgi:hypothetical protein